MLQSLLIGMKASALCPSISQQITAFRSPWLSDAAISSPLIPFSYSLDDPSGNVMIIFVFLLLIINFATCRLFDKQINKKSLVTIQGTLVMRGSTLFGTLLRDIGRTRSDPPAVFPLYTARPFSPTGRSLCRADKRYCFRILLKVI